MARNTVAGTGSKGAFTSVSGHGGTVWIYNSSRNNANGVVTPQTPNAITGVPLGVYYTYNGITNWTLTKAGVITEITHSGSMGWQQRKLIVRGGQFKLSVVWDANNLPDFDVTLDQGDEPYLALKRGANAGYYGFPSIVETCEVVDDQQKDVIRLNISGFVNGRIVNSVQGPTNGA